MRDSFLADLIRQSAFVPDEALKVATERALRTRDVALMTAVATLHQHLPVDIRESLRSSGESTVLRVLMMRHDATDDDIADVLEQYPLGELYVGLDASRPMGVRLRTLVEQFCLRHGNLHTVMLLAPAIRTPDVAIAVMARFADTEVGDLPELAGLLDIALQEAPTSGSILDAVPFIVRSPVRVKTVLSTRPLPQALADAVIDRLCEPDFLADTRFGSVAVAALEKHLTSGTSVDDLDAITQLTDRYFPLLAEQGDQLEESCRRVAALMRQRADRPELRVEDLDDVQASKLAESSSDPEALSALAQVIARTGRFTTMGSASALTRLLDNPATPWLAVTEIMTTMSHRVHDAHVGRIARRLQAAAYPSPEPEHVICAAQIVAMWPDVAIQEQVIDVMTDPGAAFSSLIEELPVNRSRQSRVLNAIGDRARLDLLERVPVAWLQPGSPRLHWTDLVLRAMSEQLGADSHRWEMFEAFRRDFDGTFGQLLSLVKHATAVCEPA